VSRPASFNTLSVWYLGNPTAPRKVGTAFLSPSRKIAFKYEPAWIEDGFDLSPDMQRNVGKRPNAKDILAPQGWDAPGAVDDAMPDRWGQSVIRIVDNPPRLTPLDFLYLAGDRRFGALGFSTDRDAYIPYSLPPLPKRDSLAEAASLIDRILSRQSVDERERILLSSSKTMGGARPKMLVEIDGHEWIAKFPKGDVVDLPLVEHATMRLAQAAGIRSAETDAIDIGVGHILLVKRFDREGSRRVHALSARSMLSKMLRPSYATMAETLRAKCPASEMEGRRREVFARFAFNVLMDNTDDHDRNHAFIMLGNGAWDLSKAYDLLPQMHGAGGRGMPVGRRRGANHFLAAVENHPEFGMSRDEAVDAWLRVAGVVSRWKEFFSGQGVSGTDIEYLAGFIDTPEMLPMRSSSIKSTLPTFPHLSTRTI
jgi:serine/threonine-protein kinase HipA